MNFDAIMSVVETITEDGLAAFGLEDLGKLAAALEKGAASVAKMIATHQSSIAVEVAGADIAADAAEDLKFKGGT